MLRNIPVITDLTGESNVCSLAAEWSREDVEVESFGYISTKYKQGINSIRSIYLLIHTFSQVHIDTEYSSTHLLPAGSCWNVHSPNCINRKSKPPCQTFPTIRSERIKVNNTACNTG